jgi:Glutaredoxin-like domain (DUF836)
MDTLILYSRPDCHLCELLAAELEPLLRGRAVLEHVDVGRDPELERRYGLRVPVLVGGGAELSSYPLDRSRVERFFTRA